MSPIGTLALAIIFGAHLLGSFTRLTRGRYTPSFYAYQLDRASNDASTWWIPYADLVLCAMMVAGPGTRVLGVSLSALMQFFGILKRVRDDKEAAVDLALVLCAIVAVLDCLFARS